MIHRVFRVLPVIRVLAVAITVALAAVPAVSCGVPGSSHPVVVGDAPKLGARSDSNPASPVGPDSAIDARQLVEFYLQAAAWGNEVTPDRPHAGEEAVARVRRFLTLDARAKWQPEAQITVVQARIEAPVAVAGQVVHVDATLLPIGVLTREGAVEPLPAGAPAPTTYQFQIESVEDGHLRIANPPTGMLLSSDGLHALYEVQPIYFWDRPGRVLVPDLRYLARSVEPEKRPDEVVTWLRAGPSSWLSSAVQSLPAGVEPKGRVVAGGPRGDSSFLVNLNARAAGVDREQLRRVLIQLRWSLRTFGGSVQLSIEAALTITVTDREFAEANPIPATDSEPTRYCVVAGQVRQAAGNAGAPAPALSSDFNNSVESAAVSRAQSVAMARLDPPPRPGLPAPRHLWLSFAERGDSSAIRYVDTRVVGASMSRPVWFDAPSPQVLIAVDGRLYDVSAGGSRVDDRTPSGLVSVTAIAVAPDGRRLAMIAGGRVYVASLQVDGDGVTVGAVRELAVFGMTEPGAIGWSREERVVVAGRKNAVVALVEVTVDGAQQDQLRLNNLGSLVVTRLVAYPQNPTKGLRGYIMIEANDQAYNVFSDQAVPLSPSNPSPSPAASPRPPVGISAPTAPFFVD